MLCVVYWNGTFLTLWTCDNYLCISLKSNCNVFLILKKSVDQYIYENSFGGSLILLNVKCILQLDFLINFVLFILWKGAKGARWRGVTYSQFFCSFSSFSWQFVLYPSVQFSFVKPGYLIWTADKLGLTSVYLCFILHLYHWGFWSWK